MSDMVAAVTTVNEKQVYEGDQWPADHPFVAAHPELFSTAHEGELEPQPEVVSEVISQPEPEPEPEEPSAEQPAE